MSVDEQAVRTHTVETLRARITGENVTHKLRNGYAYVENKRVSAISCADGFRVSVQAGENLYCTPRANTAEWTHVEMGFPSAPIPDFVEWRDGDGPDEGTVFGYVPIEKVVDLINAHGGEVRASGEGATP